MEFPQTVGGFERNEVARFSTGSSDVAVNYRLIASNSAIDATVYLMHEPLLTTLGLAPEAAESVRDTACRQEFARRLHEITVVDRAQTLSEEAIILQVGGERRHGRLARFAYQAKFAGESQELHSELARFCFAGGNWSVEYRFSYPADIVAAGWIAGFVAGLQWTGTLASP